MEILLFGITKEITGKSVLHLPDGEAVRNVADLKYWLGNQYPALAKLSSLAVAVDSEYADDDLVLNAQSEIALIPPVSGG